ESPEVLQRTGARLDPPLAPEKVKAALEIDSESSSDITTITATAANALTASSLVNAFTEEAVRHTRNFQKDEAVHADEYIGRQLASVETDLVELRKSMPPAVSALVPAGGTRGRIQL